MTFGFVETPIGTLTVMAGERIERISFGHIIPRGASFGRSALIDEASRQIAEYFAGERTAFDLPLETGGTEFQRRVWRAMQEIDFGEVLSYGALAAAIGSPSAARAVGGACHVNPICVVIPCHRVVAANGIGGFGGQPEIKISLLEHEKSIKKRLTEQKNAL